MQPEQFGQKFGVSRETLERLSIYERLLQDWGKTLSLVSRSTLDDIWNRHFADSAQILPLLRGPLLDMGTGAGFPGMVLAIMGVKDVHLSDNNQKKIEFLKEVKAQTRCKVTIHNCKSEVVPDHKFGTLTARALAPLDELLKIAAPFFGPKTQAIFLKGRSYEAEVETASHDWSFDCEPRSSLTNADSATCHHQA